MTTEQANISQGRKLSGIWIIPLLAAVLGIYMVVHTWMTEGPEITIAFNTATGLTQGKTKIKYRNVDMGLVEEVRLNDEFDGVIAKYPERTAGHPPVSRIFRPSYERNA